MFLILFFFKCWNSVLKTSHISRWPDASKCFKHSLQTRNTEHIAGKVTNKSTKPFSCSDSRGFVSTRLRCHLRKIQRFMCRLLLYFEMFFSKVHFSSVEAASRWHNKRQHKNLRKKKQRREPKLWVYKMRIPSRARFWTWRHGAVRRLYKIYFCFKWGATPQRFQCH